MISEIKRVPEQPKDENVFPVVKKASERTLASIGVDPTTAKGEEVSFLNEQNPALSFYLLRLLSKDHPSTHRHQEMLEGALYAHRLLRINQEEKNSTLPTLTPEFMQMVMRDHVDRIQDPEISLGEDFLQLWKRATENEPYIKETFHEIGKYKGSKASFYGGAAHIILAFKKDGEVKKMTKEFGFN